MTFFIIGFIIGFLFIRAHYRRGFFFSGLIPKTKYGWELNFFYNSRSFKDGLDFIEFNSDWARYKGIHSPQFLLSLIILNIVVFEINVYNREHY
jgi:hypothetical protein